MKNDYQSQLIPFLLILFVFGSSNSFVFAKDKIDYKKEIKPILAEKCFACHGGLKQESGLRLDSGLNILKGGESGKIVIPGKADESDLIEILSGEAGYAMPPEGEGTPFTKKELELITKWINQGANFPEDDQPEKDPKDFWSYKPVIKPAIPKIKNPSWRNNPIDSFIAAQYEKHQLTPVKPAQPATILRRVYLDLTGLPPTRAQLEAFLKNPSDKAYEQVVDTLLKSPQYGERWGRHWMDIWRYSDWYGSTAANQIRNSQYHIWHWRDWIVESLNKDKGYDSMLHEMLAADELAPEDTDKIRATGYLARNWYKFNRTTWLIDTVEHTNMAFLGVTMKCARCHDHKYDPIPQTDYYSFRAIFEPHGVRLDRIPEEMDIKKDGLPRVFDNEVNKKTYLFIRGDERTPDKENPIAPGVSAIMGDLPYQASEIALPLEAYYQEMRPHFIQEKMETIKQRLAKVEKELSFSKSEKSKIDQKVALTNNKITSWREDVFRDAEGTTFLDFKSLDKMKDHWTEKDGKWTLKNEVLETGIATRSKSIRLISKKNHPENFYARLTYRPSKPGHFRSIGFSYDYIKPGESQDIYTSTGDKAQSVQAFHRVNGKDVYPYSGVVKTNLKVDELTTVEVVVRGRDLRIWLNGKLKLDYIMPVQRKQGKFAIWVFSGTAQFLDFEIRGLRETSQDIKRKLTESTLALAIKEKDYEIVKSELVAFPTRVKAERAKHLSQDKKEIEKLAKEAIVAEKQADLLEKKKQFLVSDHFTTLVNNMAPNAVQGVKSLKDDAKKIQESALTALEKMNQSLEAPQGELKPLGKPHSSVSTGRRLALARWMTNPKHPRTARVAVNHIWLRHFGEAFVTPVTDFGVRSKPRTHPELLDWLAAEFMESGWKMKHLHKLLVMSNTYRLSSATGIQKTSLKNDPDNKFLWKMNSRRMEAEIIRDSLLFVTNQLDLTTGGANLPSEDKNNDSKTPYRRSLYYKTTPNKRMSFLNQFDVANPLQCYERNVSVVPQQALAMINSTLSQNSARKLTVELKKLNNREFIEELYIRFLTRMPSEKEQKLCQDFLNRHAKLLKETKGFTRMLPGKMKVTAPSKDPAIRARENLVQVLFNHNDFVSIR